MVGTWFGPISLFSPIKQVSQIISGMILFSYVLKTEEKPSKDVSRVLVFFNSILKPKFKLTAFIFEFVSFEQTSVGNCKFIYRLITRINSIELLPI